MLLPAHTIVLFSLGNPWIQVWIWYCPILIFKKNYKIQNRTATFLVRTWAHRVGVPWRHRSTKWCAWNVPEQKAISPPFWKQRSPCGKWKQHGCKYLEVTPHKVWSCSLIIIKNGHRAQHQITGTCWHTSQLKSSLCFITVGLIVRVKVNEVSSYYQQVNLKNNISHYVARVQPKARCHIRFYAWPDLPGGQEQSTGQSVNVHSVITAYWWIVSMPVTPTPVKL